MQAGGAGGGRGLDGDLGDPGGLGEETKPAGTQAVSRGAPGVATAGGISLVRAGRAVKEGERLETTLYQPLK